VSGVAGGGIAPVGVARALYAGRPAELAGTAALLRDGRISAHLAGLVVAQTRHLDPERRRAVDQQLAGEAGELAGCAPRGAAMLARRHAYRADPAGYVQRAGGPRGRIGGWGCARPRTPWPS
jgi:Domain of unknown function (DUF222)